MEKPTITAVSYTHLDVYKRQDMYGPIPIADLETLQKPEAEIVIPRLSEEAMREYIVSNLKDAANVLPYKYEDVYKRQVSMYSNGL